MKVGDRFYNPDFNTTKIWKIISIDGDKCTVRNLDYITSTSLGMLERNILVGRMKMKEDKFEKRKNRLLST